MSGRVVDSPTELRRGTATCATAEVAWELALDLFFESWRISDRWSPATALSFRRHALGLSRLIGVAAVTGSCAVVEIHLSSARRALAELDAELERARGVYRCQTASVAAWVDWSTRLGGQLSRWRLEVLRRPDLSDDSKQAII